MSGRWVAPVPGVAGVEFELELDRRVRPLFELELLASRFFASSCAIATDIA